METYRGPPNSREPTIRAFHAELSDYLQEKGRVGELLSVPTWTRLIVQGMGVMSRQSVQDITFAMDALGLIERRPRDGVIVVPSQAPGQLQPGTVVAAQPAMAQPW